DCVVAHDAADDEDPARARREGSHYDRVVVEGGGVRVRDARLDRDDALEEAAATQAYQRLRQLSHTWHEVDPSDPVREAAVRFLREHPLPAAGALQRAAA